MHYLVAFKLPDKYNSIHLNYMGGDRMIEEHIKEQLSQSYAKAVAARAGLLCSKDDYDYGFDGTFKDIISYDAPQKRYSCSGFAIDYQIKSSVNAIIGVDTVKYDLAVKNYNDLVRTDVGNARILILLALPIDELEWLHVNSDRLALRKCAWWHSLKGLPSTTNTDTQRIFIPKDQVLTPDALRPLMDRVKRGVDF